MKEMNGAMTLVPGSPRETECQPIQETMTSPVTGAKISAYFDRRAGMMSSVAPSPSTVKRRWNSSRATMNAAGVGGDDALHRIPIALADGFQIAPLPIVVPERADHLPGQPRRRFGQEVQG